MEFTQDLIRSLHSSAVFEGIPVKDLRDLLREIDSRIIELSEGQLLRRAGDRMDFYPVVVSGIVKEPTSNFFLVISVTPGLQ